MGKINPYILTLILCSVLAYPSFSQKKRDRNKGKKKKTEKVKNTKTTNIEQENKSSIDTSKIFKVAYQAYRNNEYINAIPEYEKILEVYPNNLKANYYLGLSHLNALDKEESLAFLEKVKKIKPNYDNLLDFYLAEALKYNHELDKSISYYDAAKIKFDGKEGRVKLYNTELKIEDFIALIDQRLQEVSHGRKYLADPSNATVENMGKNINSKYGDYAPVISADESVLIFTSRRKGSTGKGVDTEDNLPYEDLYIAKQDKGKWTKAKNMGKTINTKYHEASIALSPDGTELFIYQDENQGDIYVSDLVGDNWTTPKKMDASINTKYREPSVSITNDKKVLYFSSNRPGGFGGLDIYKVEKDDKGKWGEPVNLGPTINTDKNEDAPFIHFDSKTLYFSSRGHSSMGGYDIFLSELIGDKWSEPVSLGVPINSTNDDTHFVLSADYKRGYYASAKTDSYGDKDVYLIRMPDYQDVEIIDFQLSLKTLSVDFSPLITNNTKKALVILRGTVRDEVSQDLLNCKMSLIDVETNQVVDEISSVKPRGVYYTTMQTGRKYLLHVQKEGYLYHSEYFEIPEGVINQEKVLNIYLKKLEVGTALDFKALFEYNRATITKSSIPALEKLKGFLETNPKIKAEIAGHTDNIGTVNRNLILSEQRAKAVYDYLIQNGIDENRLSYKGYGMSDPVASNDTPFGRKLNRRTECRILSGVDDEVN